MKAYMFIKTKVTDREQYMKYVRAGHVGFGCAYSFAACHKGLVAGRDGSIQTAACVTSS